MLYGHPSFRIHGDWEFGNLAADRRAAGRARETPA